MKMIEKFLRGCGLLVALMLTQASAQTDGTARFEGTLLDYNGAGTEHWTVVWVTRQDGTFIKTLRKQGPSSFTSTHWNSHCSTWYSAKGTSAAFDGYTSATANTYSGTNSPVIINWNCRDANNNLVPDGTYRFWMQYAEDHSGSGPFTTNGLAWVKGLAGVTNTYPNVPSRMTNLKVTWTPVGGIAPRITSAAPTGTGKVGVPYSYTVTASGTAPVSFTASGLPTGLSISTAGVISGTPTAAGTFNGTITAANGTAPNGTQDFSIVISADPVGISSVTIENGSLVFRGTGPANGNYSVLSSSAPVSPMANWSVSGSGKFDASGHFNYTNPPGTGTQQFYRVRVP